MSKRSLPKRRPAFPPIPAALLTFCTASGRSRCLPVDWWGMVCEPAALFFAGFRADGATSNNLNSVDEFAVKLPSPGLLLSPEFRREVAALTRNKVGDGKLVPDGSQVSEQGSIEGDPVRIECHKAEISQFFDQGLIRGKILAVHLDGRRFGVDEGIGLGYLNSLIVSHTPSRPFEDRSGKRRQG